MVPWASSYTMLTDLTYMALEQDRHPDTMPCPTSSTVPVLSPTSLFLRA